MSRRALLALAALAACLVAAVPAFARSKAPVVKSVKPLKATLGQKLTITGRHFVPGRKTNTVVFMGVGKRVVWVKADNASRTKLTVTLPSKLTAILALKSGALQTTRLRLRVIAKRSARSFTPSSLSPLVSPYTKAPGGSGPGSTSGPGSGSVTGGCVPDLASASADTDGDLLPDQLEAGIGTDPCKADSDGDGIPDGYEYQSALDLNQTAGTSSVPWPYPGKQPYPNPLDASDPSVDFDGDGLTLGEEYQGSKWLGFSSLSQIHYSDGKQMTVTTVAPPADGYQDEGAAGPSAEDFARFHNDYDANGFLSDDEQDADGDGLSNWEETHGYATKTWWDSWSAHKKPVAETPYNLRPFGKLNWLDSDTDGDGLPDGADDQDQDGLTNLQEMMRNFVFSSGMPFNRRLAVNPFNPCLPNPDSPSCTRFVPFDKQPTPFESETPALPDGFFPDFPAPYSWPSWWPKPPY